MFHYQRSKDDSLSACTSQLGDRLAQFRMMLPNFEGTPLKLGQSILANYTPHPSLVTSSYSIPRAMWYN